MSLARILHPFSSAATADETTVEPDQSAHGELEIELSFASLGLPNLAQFSMRKAAEETGVAEQLEDYGMKLITLVAISETPSLQDDFPRMFGIDFTEYLERRVAGEKMGQSLIDGKWKSIHPQDNSSDE